MKNGWLVLGWVGLCACSGLEGETTNRSSQALGTPTVIRQEPGFPAANGVVQGGPTWLGQCGSTSFVLAGDIRAGAWVLPLWRDAQPAGSFGARLLAASAEPPAVMPSRGAQVCSCFDVGETQIRATLATLQGSAEARLVQLQQQLRCGTHCGACKPALHVLAGQSLVAA